MEIPKDIQRIVASIQTPSTNTPIEKYDSDLANLFPNYSIVNITEFDYGRSYRYLIFLKPGIHSAILNEKKLQAVVVNEKQLDGISLAVSAVSPYLLLELIQYRVTNESRVISEWRDEPISAEQASASEKILSFYKKLGYTKLTSQVAELKVPGEKTELQDEPTVADFLFFG